MNEDKNSDWQSQFEEFSDRQNEYAGLEAEEELA